MRLHFTDVLGSKISLQCLKPGLFWSPSRIILSLGIPAASAALMAVGRSSTRVTNALAPESFNWNVSSSAVYAGFAGVMTPHAHKVPQVTEGVSIWLVLVPSQYSDFFWGWVDSIWADLKMAKTSPLRQPH